MQWVHSVILRGHLTEQDTGQSVKDSVIKMVVIR
jgi:hypothetical protein